MAHYKYDRHNFDPQFKLHLCCGNDDIRPVFQYIHFIGGYAYATDAHVLIRAKIADISNFTEEEIAMLNNKAISGRLFRQLIQRRSVEVTPEGFVWNDESGDIAQTFKFHNIDDDRKMNLYKMQESFKIPNMDAIIDDTFTTQPTPQIGIKVECFEWITRAMGCEILAMYFKGDNKGIMVRPAFTRHEPTLDIVGVIMPCLLDMQQEYVRTIPKE